MYQAAMLVWTRRAAHFLFGAGVCVAMPFFSGSASAISSVTLAWNPSSSTDIVGYKIYCGVTCGTYNNAVFVANTTNGTISGLVEGTTYYFAATTYNSSGAQSPFSNEVFYSVPTNTVTVNQRPTLNSIHDLTIKENADVAIT